MTKPTNKQEQTNASIITARRNRALDRQGYVSLVLRVLILVLVGWVLLTRIFLITQVSGNDMFPTLKDGDLVFAYRLQDGYFKNDVVVFTQDGEQKVGRIIGRAGDTIGMDDSGTLRVNGTIQVGDIMYPTYAKENFSDPYVVPDGHVFILCDYRTQCEDSRDFGPISLRDVDGKVITFLRRRSI